jgi:alkylation response protein AidB-like acyl-CoA dehydrogenase
VDLALTPEQLGFQRAVRDFAHDVLAGHGAPEGREGFPLDLVRRVGELGLFGLPFPERYGGLDADLLTLCVCVEELARVDPFVATVVAAAAALGANAFFRCGTEEQATRWLVPMARGRAIGALAIGEGAPEVSATARPEGGEWVLDGRVAAVENAATPITSAFVVAVRFEEAGVGAIVVETDASGVEVGPAGPRGGPGDPREVVLRGARAPEANRLSRCDQDGSALREVLDDGRVALSAVAVGTARSRLERGPGIPSEAMVEAARLDYLRAARLRDHGRPYAAEAAIAERRTREIACGLGSPGTGPV